MRQGSRRLRIIAIAGLAAPVLLAARAAEAQGFQQTFSTTQPGGAAQSTTLPFSPTAPTAAINLSDPIVGAGFTNNATSASSTITSGSGTVATFNSAPGSRAVTVQIPSLGVNQVFTGADRASNYSQALYFAEQRAPGLFNPNPISPFARPTNTSNPAVGNPLSLVPQMVSRDFRIATGIGDFEPNLGRGASSLARIPSVITAGGELSYASSAGTDLWAFTVPLDYKHFFDDPRYSLSIDVPLTFLRIGNANVGLGSAGATFRMPITDDWSIGVGARVGAVGSEQLRVGDTAYSATLSSQYKLYLGDYILTVGNAVGVLKTNGFRVGALDTGPSLTNVPISNGLSLQGSLPFTMFDKPASYEAYVADTYFAGQSIAVKHYDEIGFNIGTRAVLGEQSWNQARFGIAYTVGRSYQGASLRFSYRF